MPRRTGALALFLFFFEKMFAVRFPLGARQRLNLSRAFSLGRMVKAQSLPVFFCGPTAKAAVAI
jgi:hypothetical protein